MIRTVSTRSFLFRSTLSHLVSTVQYHYNNMLSSTRNLITEEFYVRQYRLPKNIFYTLLLTKNYFNFNSTCHGYITRVGQNSRGVHKDLKEIFILFF